MARFLERYLAGEHEQVWSDLLRLGDQIRQEPFWSEAEAVTRETMRRARANVELLVPRLRAIGYRFIAEEPDAAFYVSSAFIPPNSISLAHVRTLQQSAGVFPLSLQTWYDIVGSVNLMGSHPGLPEYFDRPILPDPMVVDPITQEHLEEYSEWLGDYEEFGAGEVGAFCVDIAPDEYHKADISGGGPYCIELPNPAIDGILLSEWHKTTFVNYLRICFRWGGFPGFERFHPHERPAELLAHLTTDLLPI